MGTPSIVVNFVITFNSIKYEFVSELLEITPNQFWNVGDKIKVSTTNKPDRLRTYGCWTKSVKANDEIFIEKPLNEIIDFIQLKKDTLIKLKNNFMDVEYKIDFVIEFYDITPAIYFEKDILKLLSEIEAEIDFDLYNLKGV